MWRKVVNLCILTRDNDLHSFFCSSTKNLNIASTVDRNTLPSVDNTLSLWPLLDSRHIVIMCQRKDYNLGNMETLSSVRENNQCHDMIRNNMMRYDMMQYSSKQYDIMRRDKICLGLKHFTQIAAYLLESINKVPANTTFKNTVG